MSWFAGAATTRFEIDPGTPMAGYLARTGGTERTADPLTITALALVSGDHRCVLLAIDLIAVDRGLTDEIARQAGLKPAELAMAASHTHSGPAGVIPRLHAIDEQEIDSRLRMRIILRATAVVRQALERLESATLRYGTSTVAGIAANRNDPAGPIDPTVSVLQAVDQQGSPIATAVHFACHPTILPASSCLISAEFPGAMRRALATEISGAVLYLNGAAGDISTRFTRVGQDFAEVRRVGEALAHGALTAMAQMRDLADGILAGQSQVQLPCRGAADLAAAAMQAQIAADRLARGGLSAAERRIEETRQQGAELLSRLLAEKRGQTADEIGIDWWELDGLRLVAIPGELFASLGSQIRAVWPDTLVLGYTNGYVGYLPDRRAYQTGCYEALASPYAEGVGESLVAQIVGAR